MANVASKTPAKSAGRKANTETPQSAAPTPAPEAAPAPEPTTETPAPIPADVPDEPKAEPQPEAPTFTERPSRVTDRDFWAQYVDQGYTLTSWTRAHYALVKKDKGTDEVGGPAWYTVTDFGTRKPAVKGSDAEQNGRDRTDWCEQSAAYEAQVKAAKDEAARKKAERKAKSGNTEAKADAA